VAPPSAPCCHRDSTSVDSDVAVVAAVVAVAVVARAVAQTQTHAFFLNAFLLSLYFSFGFAALVVVANVATSFCVCGA